MLILKKSFVNAGLAFLCGAAMALTMPPTAWWPVLFLCLGFFYIQLTGLTARTAAVYGWLFGFGYFLAGLYWIGNALLVPGNDFKWVWPFAIIGLPVGLAFFHAAAAWVAVRFSDLEKWSGYWLFCLSLMVAEWLRGHILTGFPWNLFGYTWVRDLPMVQSVSVVGIYGLSLLSILWGALPGFLYASRPPMRVWIPTLLVLFVSIGGIHAWGKQRLRLNPTENLRGVMVRVVQPSIPQEDKWTSDKLIRNLEQTVEASSGHFIPGKTYAVIWPETAISDTMMKNLNVADYIEENIYAKSDKRYLLSGTLRHVASADSGTRYFNSLVAYDSHLMPVSISDKSHLVPFGEYIPLQNILPLHPFVQFSGFTAGQGHHINTVDGLPPYESLVCYEVIFPEDVAAISPRPEWIINVTNDGWYGDSPGPYQHLAMAIFRATENGIPLVRSANTGISAVIDPLGRILHKLAYNREGFIDSPLPKALPEPTPFSRHPYSSFWGPIFLLFLIYLKCKLQKQR